MDLEKPYDVICIGNFTKDTIHAPSGTRIVDGGAMNYAAHAAAGLGLRTGVVTRLAKEDARVVERLRERGVDCFVTYTPASTCLKLEYPTANPDVRSISVTSTAGSITAQEVLPLQTRAAVIGSSLRGEVRLEVVQMLRAKGVFLAADMQGFIRVLRGESLVYEPWEEMASTLAYLDVVKSDAVEAAFLTGESDIYKAAQIYASMGPAEIMLTHKNGVLVYAQGEFHEAGFYPRSLIGRSGRGDTCVGAYVAKRLSAPPQEAGIWAAAVTSLKMESLGPFNRDIQEVKDLIDSKYR